MRIHLLVMMLLLAGSTAHLAAPVEPTTRLRPLAAGEWLLGKWHSTRLDHGSFGEWNGTQQIELVAHSSDWIDLILISTDGMRLHAGDSQPSFLDEKRSILFFGPIGSGLLFRYQRRSEDVLVIDLDGSGARIHAELRRSR